MHRTRRILLLEALVSRSFAKRYWKDAVSARPPRASGGIHGDWFTIVGVVADVHLDGARSSLWKKRCTSRFVVTDEDSTVP